MGTAPDPIISPTARIRDILDARGMTYTDLADLLVENGITYKRVLRVIKNDLSEPRTAEVIAFAKALDVPLPSLYEPVSS